MTFAAASRLRNEPISCDAITTVPGSVAKRSNAVGSTPATPVAAGTAASDDKSRTTNARTSDLRCEHRRKVCSAARNRLRRQARAVRITRVEPRARAGPIYV